MITYFPTPYPDESFYSVFARYGVGEGLYSTRYCNEKLHCKQTYTDMNYMNDIAPDVKRLLTRDKDWKTVIKEHTIYNYMTSFLPADQKERALECLAQGDELYRKIIPPFPKYEGVTNHIKYCPVCVEEDREKYGETYWHREWMIPEIRACYKHHCYLYDGVEMNATNEQILCPAEVNIPTDTELQRSDAISDQIASYAHELMNNEHTLQVPLEKILMQELIGTEYISKAGGKLKIKRLWDDLISFYNEDAFLIRRQRRLSDILHGKIQAPFEIIRVLVYFQIPIEKVYGTKSVGDPYKESCDQIIHLYKTGMSQTQIAKKLNLSRRNVEWICTRYMKEQRGELIKIQDRPNNQKHKQEELRRKDTDLARRLKIIMDDDFFSDFEECITCESIFRKLEGYGIFLNKNCMRSLPKCDTLIRSYCESYEHYWARKLCRAVNEIEEEHVGVTIGQIQKRTFLSRDRIVRSMEEIRKRDEKVWEKLKLILN